MIKLISKVITFENKKTCIRLTKDESLELICQKENIKRNSLLNLINQTKNQEITLTNSIRLFSTIYFYHELIRLTTYDITTSSPPSISEAISVIL